MRHDIKIQRHTIYCLLYAIATLRCRRYAILLSDTMMIHTMPRDSRHARHADDTTLMPQETAEDADGDEIPLFTLATPLMLHEPLRHVIEGAAPLRYAD